MYRIRKRFRFEAAHQLEEAYSAACSDCIHGHSYIVDVYIVSRTLNTAGMVMDFGLVSKICCFIKEEWDHALFLPSNIAIQHQNLPEKTLVTTENPTAENMAKWIYQRIFTDIQEAGGNEPEDLKLQKVRVHETHTGWAEFGEVM